MDRIIKAISNANNFALITHKNPDADGLGSMCALYYTLKKMKKNVKMFCDSAVPERLKFLPFTEDVYTDIKDIENEKFDLFISMDCSSADRFGKFEKIFIENNLIVIDHHASNTGFGNINLTEIGTASCCEIMYHLIKKLKIRMDEKIGICIYAGISSDTGSFVHGNTTAEALRIASVAGRKIPRLKKVIFNLFKRRSLKEILVLQKAYADLKFIYNNTICLVSLKKDFLDSINYIEPLASFVTSHFGAIDGVYINLFICEYKKDIIDFSFRSVGEVDVASVALKLGGGGHRNASGAMFHGDYETALKIAIKACEEEVDRCKAME